MGFLEENSKKRAEAAQKKAGANSIRKDEWLATMSNPDSNIDELGTIVRRIILPLFAIWVWYIGYLFTSKELAGVVDPWQVSVLSFLLPGTIQFLKLYGAKKVLRAFHFKWYDRTAHDFWLWSIVALVVGLMFVWSLKISIFDVKDTAKQNYAASNSDSLSVVLAAATSGIDAQINALNQSSERAGSMKTKKGKIAWSGQSIEMNNSATLSGLTEQKKAIVDQTIADYKAGRAQVETESIHRGNFFQRFGGFGEVGEILFCLILGLIEAINRASNIERLSSQQNEEPATPATNSINVQNGQIRYNSNSKPINNAAPGTPQAFFFNRRPDGNVNAAPTVAQYENTVPQNTQHFNVMGCNEILNECKRKIQADIGNFNQSYAKPESVSRRINTALENCRVAMEADGFCPARDIGAAFYGYLAETVFPTLNDRGWPYSNDKFFMKKLLSVLPAGDPVTA